MPPRTEPLCRYRGRDIFAAEVRHRLLRGEDDDPQVCGSTVAVNPWRTSVTSTGRSLRSCVTPRGRICTTATTEPSAGLTTRTSVRQLLQADAVLTVSVAPSMSTGVVTTERILARTSSGPSSSTVAGLATLPTIS